MIGSMFYHVLHEVCSIFYLVYIVHYEVCLVTNMHEAWFLIFHNINIVHFLTLTKIVHIIRSVVPVLFQLGRYSV